MTPRHTLWINSIRSHSLKYHYGYPSITRKNAKICDESFLGTRQFCFSGLSNYLLKFIRCDCRKSLANCSSARTCECCLELKNGTLIWSLKNGYHVISP